MSQSRSSRVVKADQLPRRLPFLGIAILRRRQSVGVYVKLAPRRRWKLMLIGQIAGLPTRLP